MVDYYEELNIDSSLSVDEINKLLSKLENTWKRRELTSPEKATKMLALIIDARGVFQSVATKSRYDQELAQSKTSETSLDPRQQRNVDLRKWKSDAETYLRQGEHDLAKIAIDRALALSVDSSDDALYALAAEIHMEIGENDAALSYINNAIVTNPQNGLHYFVKACIYGGNAVALRFSDKAKSMKLYGEERKTLQAGLSVAISNNDTFARARLMGGLAFSLYYEPDPNQDRAAELAREALALGDDTGNAQKVMDDVNAKFEAIRKEEEARQEEERKKRERDETRKKAVRSAAYQSAIDMSTSRDMEKVKKAISIFESMTEYKDSAELSERAREHLKELKEQIYCDAAALSGSEKIVDLYEASRKYESILEYKDSKQCNEKIKSQIELVREKEIAKEKKQKIKKAAVILSTIAVTIVVLVFLFGSTDNGLSRMAMSDYYRMGLDNFQNGNYYAAIRDLKQVSEQSRYHDKAVALLEDSYGPYSKDIISQAEQYSNEGDSLNAYATVQSALQSSIPEDSIAGKELITYRSAYETSFRSTTLQTAYDFISVGDFGHAKTLLEEPFGMLYYGGELENEVSELYYECDRKVVHPWETSTVTFTTGNYETAYTATDNMGTEYTDVFFNCEAGSDDKLTWESVVFRDYSKLVGTFFATYDGRNGYSSGWLPYLRIYCDDVLVYEFEMSGDNEPQDFEIDFSGVNQVRVEYDGWGNEVGYLTGISNFFFYYQ